MKGLEIRDSSFSAMYVPRRRANEAASALAGEVAGSHASDSPTQLQHVLTGDVARCYAMPADWETAQACVAVCLCVRGHPVDDTPTNSALAVVVVSRL